MKKYSMETILGIFVVSEGFLPDFTGLRLANTFAKRWLNLNGRCAEIRWRDIRTILHLFFLFQGVDKFING